MIIVLCIGGEYMGYALKIYEAFEELGKERAAILAEFVEYMESRRAATSEEVRESELRLQKEIEQVRKEVKEVELRLRGEIEQVRLEVEQVRKEMKEVELRLQKEIKEVELQLRGEIEQVRLEVERVRSSLVKWMFIFWTGQVIAIIGILRWLLH
jgi:methyl-accepting chemotaxis protein